MGYNITDKMYREIICQFGSHQLVLVVRTLHFRINLNVKHDRTDGV